MKKLDILEPDTPVLNPSSPLTSCVVVDNTSWTFSLFQVLFWVVHVYKFNCDNCPLRQVLIISLILQ